MKRSNLVVQCVLNAICILLCALIVFPFWMLISVSLSSEKDIVYYGYQILPKHFDLTAYQYVFQNASGLLRAYGVTATFSFATMALATLAMASLAFLLSKKSLKGKKGVAFYLYFTMLFGGGLVPTYLVNTQMYHLDNTIWIYILPALVNPWYVFMIRTFFQGLPYELTEAAKIDGASEYRIFFGIILPLSKPVLATVALFVLLGKWNDWFTAMLYISRESLISLQFMLQRIMTNIEVLKALNNQGTTLSGTVNAAIPAETVRMAMAVVVAGPMLCVFPFFQQYFVKGMTVGSVKG